MSLWIPCDDLPQVNSFLSFFLSSGFFPFCLCLWHHQSPGGHAAAPIKPGPAGREKQQRGSDCRRWNGHTGESSKKSVRPRPAQQGQQMWASQAFIAIMNSRLGGTIGAFVTASSVCRGTSYLSRLHVKAGCFFLPDSHLQDVFVTMWLMGENTQWWCAAKL